MQDTTEFRTNRDLFSNHYLDEHLPETDAWESVDSADLQEAYDDIVDLWEDERDLVADRNESQLEEKFIRPMFRKLGIPFEVEESVEQGQRRPDYGFFESDEGARNAFKRRRDGGDFYKNAVAVADAKRWGRKLDTRGEQQRDFENPSYQIHVYLQETPATWAVLTNGEYWRLYYGPTSHRLDSYYEIDLPAVLESGDLETFKYFYLFFQHEAFLPDTSGDCFLDDVYSESNVFAEELGEDLQDNIYDAIQSLAEGFLTYPDNDLGADDLDLIHDSSLIYLYRLIFVLYAESEGRDLLNTDNEIYEQSYSLNTIKQEVAEELDSDHPSYQSWQDNLWDRIDELFQLIDQGSASRGIPEEDLHVPAYNGGLFRTNPDPDGSREARFLATHTVGDEHLARVIELLTRSQTGSSGKIFVDYSSLDVRHLGSVYEGLLEYQLNVADEPLTLDDGEYVLATEDDDVVVEPDEVYLTTDSGERKATGSYYTPEYVVEYIVENTLEPLVDDIREDLAGNVSYGDETGFAEEFADRIFELKILDPAMGSGHFLTNTIDYLAREIIDAQERQAEQQGVETVGEGQDINWARRQVAQHCIYGVDLNPLAVELAKVSLWLRTLAAEQPLAFLDHHLKTGNSLVGSDIEAIDELETDANDGPNASLADFGAVRRGTIDHLMDVYEEFIAIENTNLADAKEMERKYREIERDDLRNRLVAMANVETAEDFGLDLPSGAYERMARVLDTDDEWAAVEATDWFETAQSIADGRNFLHWKLEFPEVFYEVDGTDRENPGFDAVIGNPPYISVTNLDSDLRNYLTNTENYRTATGRYDAYIVFLEQSLNLCRPSGFLSMIVPIKWAIYGNGRVLRDILLDEVRLSSLTNVSQAEIFDGPTTYPCIPVVQNSVPNENSTVHILNIPSDHPDLLTNRFASLRDQYGTAIPIERFKSAPRRVVCPYLNDDNWRVHSKLNDQSKQLGEIYRLEQAIRMGSASAREELFTTDSSVKDDPAFHPVVDGEHIDRYYIDWDGRYLHYVPDRLYNAKSKELLHQPKILLKRIAERMTAAYDDGVGENDFYYPLNTVYTLTPNDAAIQLDDLEINPKFHTALLNSNLLDWDYKLLFAAIGIRGGYIEFREYLEHLPLYDVDFELPAGKREAKTDQLHDEVERYLDRQITKSDIQQTLENSISESGEVAHDLLVRLVDRLSSLRSEREALNTDITDYLGKFAEGESLIEISGYQPASGRSESILSKTAADKENLRIGTVSTEKQGNTTTIYASGRYKPQEQDDYETDQWGYTETELYPVIEFVGLSEEYEALVEEFIPHAVSEAGGYAGFREKATKTNSIIDRLEVMYFPAVADVSKALSNYVEIKSKADGLDQVIADIDSVIDYTIYSLYGLSDNDIETIESGHSG
jgi:type II restriction/modification system DNA methylase subunit YeeA